MKLFIKRFNPVLKKNWLHLMAGVVWASVGGMLTLIASQWLKPVDWVLRILIISAGLAAAAVISRWGFSRFAIKNIFRIDAYVQEKVCLFAFQKWSSYPLVAFMISLGIYLRKYSPFPKPALAVLYFGIGGGLFLASRHYFQHIFQNRQSNMQKIKIDA